MDEKKINLLICCLSLVIYLIVAVWAFVKMRNLKRRLKEEGRKIPSPDSKFRPASISSSILLLLPFLIYFKPYITAVLEACAILGLYIVLRERISLLKEDTNSQKEP